MEDEYFAAFGDDFIDFDEDFNGPLSQVDSELSAPILPPLPPRPRQSAFRQTNPLRAQIPEGELEPKISAVLAFMKREGINLALFLDAIFWGDAACTANRDIVHERTNFLDSPDFEVVLNRIWKPPTRAKSHNLALHGFVCDAMAELLETEMASIALVLTPPNDALSKEHLAGVNFRALGQALQKGAPETWRLFERLATTARGRKENTMKDAFLVSYVPQNLLGSR